LKQTVPDRFGLIVEPQAMTRKLLHDEPLQSLAVAMA
jgi:hypothetical protein